MFFVSALLLFPLCVAATALSLNDHLPQHGLLASETGSYCSTRPGVQCCPGRDDKCTVAFFDTLCYCDIFCNRTLTDCCPDFIAQCFGGIEPQPLRTKTPPANVKSKRGFTFTRDLSQENNWGRMGVLDWVIAWNWSYFYKFYTLIKVIDLSGGVKS